MSELEIGERVIVWPVDMEWREEGYAAVVTRVDEGTPPIEKIHKGSPNRQEQESLHCLEIGTVAVQVNITSKEIHWWVHPELIRQAIPKTKIEQLLLKEGIT